MTILDEAKRLVYGDRERDYSPPDKDFARVVGMLNALFSDKLVEPLVPSDWALIMVCCKLAREVHKHKWDNLVDIAGYAETASRVHLASGKTKSLAAVRKSLGR